MAAAEDVLDVADRVVPLTVGLAGGEVNGDSGIGRAVIDGVRTGAAVEHVIAGAADKRVIPCTGVDDVVAFAAVDGVIPVAGGDGVVPGAAENVVVAGAGIDGRRRPRRHRQCRCRRR